jgi:hypothetical protein
MESEILTLKFGTAYFIFRNEKQMRGFLESSCVVKQGRIHLHHGYKYHLFTELSKAYEKNVPKDAKVPQYSRYLVSKGGGIKSKNDDLDLNLQDI